MKITPAVPTSARQPHDWTPLIETLTAHPDTWFNVPLTDLPGASNHQKQVNVHGAGRRNNLSVQTRVEAEFLFVRTKTK
ncbi:MAG TPA: hypothetical protein VGM02_01635 [Acidobacteriaceae bacterium]|jgi:hypothetical protein